MLLRPDPGAVHLAQPGAPATTLEEQIADAGPRPRRQRRVRDLPRGRQLHPGATRSAAIDRLRELGLERMAERAEAMTNVLAPRPGGFLAALDAAPEADVVLVAHTGLDHLLTVGDVWRELPMDKRIVMRWWQVPREEIPTGREERIEWLFDWWEHIDAWIEEHRPEELPRTTTARPAASSLTGTSGGRDRRRLWGRPVGCALLVVLDVDDLGGLVGRRDRVRCPRRRRRGPRRARSRRCRRLRTAARTRCGAGGSVGGVGTVGAAGAAAPVEAAGAEPVAEGAGVGAAHPVAAARHPRHPHRPGARAAHLRTP